MGQESLEKVFMETVDVMKLSGDQQLPFISLVDKIVDLKKENPKADTSALEKQIDDLVYKLYNLTPEEIQTIESSVK